MGKIGFFGGCFNPPNNLHIEIANNLIKEKKVDKVVFIPVNDLYTKEGLIDAKHRYNMLKIAVEKYDCLDVDDIELNENRKLYAIDAFELIKNNAVLKGINEKDIYFIMGSDNYSKMPNWKDYNFIKDKYSFIVVNRDINDITSTKIRQMIKENNEDVKKYLADDVYKYIIENKLYK